MISDDTIRIAHGQDETYRMICETFAMSSPGERLRQARMARGYATPKDAADAFGWNEVTYRAHENGGRGIKTEVAERYARALNAKASWILLGDGEAPVPSSKPPARPALYEAEPDGVIETGPVFLPPVGGRPHDVIEYGAAVAGDGDDESAFEMNGQQVDVLRRPPGLMHRKDVFAIRVTNVSMYPRFEHGDRLFLEKRPAGIGEFVVVELHPKEEGAPGKAYIKKLLALGTSKITVEQFNPHGTLDFSRREIKQIFRVIPQKELLGI